MAKSRKNDDYEEDTTYAPEDNPRRNARGHRQEYAEFEVALWVTNLNPTEIGIYKHFTAERNWRGTLDLLLGRSVQLTHGAGGFPVPAYSINVTGHDQLVQVERSAY